MGNPKIGESLAPSICRLTQNSANFSSVSLSRIYETAGQLRGRSTVGQQFLPRDAMRKRGLCCGPVSAVRLSVCHVRAFYIDG